MPGSSATAGEAALTQSLRQEEAAEGSLAGPRGNHPWAVASVEEGGCPLRAEVEESWSAGVAGGAQVWRSSWQTKEEVEEEGLGPEVVGEGPQPVVEEEAGERFQGSEKKQKKTIQHNA